MDLTCILFALYFGVTIGPKLLKNQNSSMKRSREFSVVTNRDVGIFVGTFNTDSVDPTKMDLKQWLNLEEKKVELDGQMPDLVIIGLQEINWINTVGEVLGTEYVERANVHMFGVLLVLYMRQSSQGYDSVSISNLQTDKVETGTMKIVGNKGGAGISFLLNDSVRVCFVNTHLTHGQGMENLIKRNKDYHKIVKDMFFGPKAASRTIMGHDLVIWMGDLNYRLNYQDSNIICSLLKGIAITWSAFMKEYACLLGFDELNQQREGILNGFPNDAPPPAFTSFEEQPITFLPTYKYDPGTDKYDTSPKKRFPAWCDRILYQTDLDLVQTSYESVPPPFDSDQENSEFLSIPKKEKKHRNRLRKKLRSASHTQDSSGASPKQPKSRERLTKAPPAG
ncbi:inositol polyphosphate 5-phosphatase OCRL-1 [Ditylenchus destructor]|nr:inositol polyphosphate 5-phosphatase OCRL-1 [Ditylenchus destructor]